jgi:phenylacetate-CoA ligase
MFETFNNARPLAKETLTKESAGSSRAPFLDVAPLNSRTQQHDPWQERGERMALKLFHAMGERVPAYKHFLKAHGIDHRRVRTIRDFKQVPQVDKNNYLRSYPLESLCWDGVMHNGGIISSSTGSSGQPSYWPRFEAQEQEAIDIHEIILRDIFQADQYSTLAVVSFSMGIYIAGVLTANCTQALGKKGYAITTATPGIDKNATIKLVKELSGSYGQIVFAGYPPFVKDIIEAGEREGIDWKKKRVRFLFAAEGFSEVWRDFMHAKVGSTDALMTSVNIYGTADAVIMGHETPLSIMVRRDAFADPALEHALFGEVGRVPTLTQYYPQAKYFEMVNKELTVTTPSGIPLIRYNLHDHGGIVSYDTVAQLWEARGESLESRMRKAGAGHCLWTTPFVYVFGRSDFSATLYGLNIYPEHVRSIVETQSMQKYLTGKFVMRTAYRQNFDQYLDLHMELRPEVKGRDELRREVTDYIFAQLQKVNAEYGALTKSIGDRARPEVELCAYQDARYFAQGVKHVWKQNN